MSPGSRTAKPSESAASAARSEFHPRQHGVRYQVADVERSVAFYCEHLGFQRGFVSPAFASVTLDNLWLLLSGVHASGSRDMPDGRRQEPGGWNRIVLYVESLDDRIEQLRKAGVTFRNTVESGPGGRQILFDDPDGNPVELHEAPRPDVSK